MFAGQCRLIELGYRQGGPAGFGLRRQLVDQFGNAKQLLKSGEHKSLQTDRVILVSGPSDEILVVEQIYKWFVEEGKSESWIANRLNQSEGPRPETLLWTRGIVRQILSNEKYIGNNVFNRSSFKLKQRRVVNPPEQWIRKEGAFQAIIEPSLFFQAQGIFRERSRRFSNEEMLGSLKELYESKGVLSGVIIDEFDHMPSSSAYRLRFGSLIRAYELIGFTPDRDYSYLEINRQLRQIHQNIIETVISQIGNLGGNLFFDEQRYLYLLNHEITLSIIIARSKLLESGNARWKLRFDAGLKPDMTIAIRMDHDNEKPLDYYIFPHLDLCADKLNLSRENGLEIDLFRFDDLSALYWIGQRFDLAKVA